MVFFDQPWQWKRPHLGNEYSYLTISTTKLATSGAQNLNHKPIEFINSGLLTFHFFLLKSKFFIKISRKILDQNFRTDLR